MPLSDARDSGGDLLECGGDVGSGIAVRDRKDIDLVESLGAVRNETRPRDDRAGETLAVQVADSDHDFKGSGAICREGSFSPLSRACLYSSAMAGSRSR